MKATLIDKQTIVEGSVKVRLPTIKVVVTQPGTVTSSGVSVSTTTESELRQAMSEASKLGIFEKSARQNDSSD
jgi:hypothetical protein